jgi:branched-chain amino acid aminotransferase
MSLRELEKIWMNGKLVDWKDANIHILSHVIHYGSSFFEGIRCYNTEQGSAVFCLPQHLKRLRESGKIYRMDIPYSNGEISDAIFNLIKVNKLDECYIRPIVYRGYGDVSINPLTNPVETTIAVWEWGKYLGKDAIEKGVDVCVSSWHRAAPNTFPTHAKAAGNYLNSQLAKMEAITNGYAEAIMLDYRGFISEASGANIFFVKDNVIYTPPTSSAILVGVTRNVVIELARDLGYRVREMDLVREFAYTADEAFFTGTAAELTPIRSVDKIKVGSGERSEVTKRIQDKFFDIIHTGNDEGRGWMTFIDRKQPIKA